MTNQEKKDAVVIIFDTGQSGDQKDSKDEGTFFDKPKDRSTFFHKPKDRSTFFDKLKDMRSFFDKPKDMSTFFDKAKDCISWILKRKIMSMSKDLVCLLLTGTDESGEPDDEGDADDDSNASLCKNFNVKFDFQLASWDMLDFIENKVKPLNSVSDWVGALALATEKLKLLEGSYNIKSRAVVIFSDLKDTFTDALDHSLANIKDLNIEITVIGPDYISLKPEDKEDDEPCSKKRRLETEVSSQEHEKRIDGEKILRMMWDSLGDLVRITNFDSALRQLSSYSRKTVRANPWNCVMDIGDVRICVQVFKKIDKKTPLRANLKCVKPDSNKAGGSSKPTLADVVRDKIMYYKHEVQDKYCTEDISVGEDEIIYGYRYGTSVIPFSDEDKLVMEYKPGKKCFSVLGFTPSESVRYYTLTGEGAYIVVPRENDEKSEVALSALIQAMSETGNVAIVRRVYSDDRGLSLGVLYPVVEEGQSNELNHKECLVFIELGFHEDIRRVRLPRLKRLKRKITNEQYKAIDGLMEEMDLMKVESGVKGETFEALDLCSRHEMRSQFFQHCVVHKALYPDERLPTYLPAHSSKYMTQLHSFKNKDKVCHKTLMYSFPTEDNNDSENENSAVNDYTLYRFRNNEEKTAMNCVKRLFAIQRCPPVAAVKQFFEISINEFNFKIEDVVEAFLHFMRKARREVFEEFPEDYNFWIQRVRMNIGVQGELVESFWKAVIEANLGLITVNEHEDACTKEADAARFIHSLTYNEQEVEEERRRMEADVRDQN